MKTTWLTACVLGGAVSAALAQPDYVPRWASLARHEAAPEWFQDAKIGIYFHWGVYSVPAFGSEWYPHSMSLPWHPTFEHHVATYGHPAEFGYHDFVPQFTAEDFDPASWAELFAEAGARFAGLVAEHHDGFSMWDSEVTPWNVADKGPKRDITGELFTELRSRRLKTIATFHHARNLQRYPVTAPPESEPEERYRWLSHYQNWEDYPAASDDSELRYLYGNLPEAQWLEEVWLGKLTEVVDKYQPDIVWFDSWLDEIPEDHRQRFAAHYLNQAQAWGREVVIVRKQNDLPLNFTVKDHEKSREPKALEDVWMTDDTISTGSWCYTEDLKVKSLTQVLHAAIDTVAKNGIVLLNLSPRADGVIPDDQRAVLRGLGDWLEANGEAIYATRTWVVAGEGPTTEPSGGFDDADKFLELEYSAADVRYTRSKDGAEVYAVVLGSLDAGAEVVLSGFAAGNFDDAPTVRAVRELSSGRAVHFEQGSDGLKLVAPAGVSETPAVAFEIEL